MRKNTEAVRNRREGEMFVYRYLEGGNKTVINRGEGELFIYRYPVFRRKE